MGLIPLIGRRRGMGSGLRHLSASPLSFIVGSRKGGGNHFLGSPRALRWSCSWIHPTWCIYCQKPKVCCESCRRHVLCLRSSASLACFESLEARGVKTDGTRRVLRRLQRPTDRGKCLSVVSPSLMPHPPPRAGRRRPLAAPDQRSVPMPCPFTTHVRSLPTSPSIVGS